jgi:hypothetical protein
MDLYKILSLLGACAPAVAVVSAVVAKETLNLDPVSTLLYEIPGFEALRKYNACLELSDELEYYVMRALVIAIDCLDAIKAGKLEVASECYNNLTSTANNLRSKWLETVKWYKSLLSEDVLEKAYPTKDVMEIANDIEEIAGEIKYNRDVYEVGRLIAVFEATAPRFVKDGYVMCLKYTSVLKQII